MASSVHGSDVSDVIPQAPAAPAAAAAAAQLTPTAKDVARRHRRWNTGSAAQLALYRHDWKFSSPLKHFLCVVHTLNCSRQVGDRTGKTYRCQHAIAKVYHSEDHG